MSSLKYIFTIVFVIIFANANAKVNIDNQIDSLDAKLQKNYEIGASAKENLELIRKLYELTKISEPYLALEYAGQALQLGVTEDNKTIQAEWSEAIADIYFEQKVYYLAMEDYFNAYSLYLSDGEKEKCAYALLKYGDTYFIQNVEDVAMSNYVKADSLFMDVKSQEGHAAAMDRIGQVELERYQYDKAMSFFNDALTISQNIKNQKLVAETYRYMASVYDQNEDFDNEEKYLNNAITKFRLAGDKFEMAKTYYMLGEMHYKNEEYDKAYMMFMRACNIFQDFGMITNVAAVNNKLGRLSFLQGDFGVAERQAKEALTMSDLNQWLTEKTEALLLLADINNKLGRTDSAYIFLSRFTIANDSLYEQKRAENFSELQVSISTKDKEKELAIAEQSLQKNKIITLIIIGIAGLIVLFMIYAIVNSAKIKKVNSQLATKNDEINKQKDEILHQKEIVDNVNAEIRLRNDEIEEINQSITSSINYAARIQKAMLPHLDFIKTHFADGFVYFYPREVVSGDFYWFSEVKTQRPPSLFRRKDAEEDDSNKLIVATIDCTGHGVPGAFMSMLGDAFLNQIVNVQKIVEPDLILNELHKLVRTTLQQETTENNDGMDAAICVIDKANHKLTYAGAKNPLIYIQDDKIEKINGDLKSIGGMQKEDQRVFTRHEIDIEKSTIFYIYSDGYQDQFGGKEGRKYMAKRFRDKLTENYKRPFSEQKELLHNHFVEWRGNRIQMDDTTIIGIKIN
ncbi:MAG: SpoIIE family protein phosphatase [Bacteroidales bacterium]|nr:SpoIIE family protein phosphatase [Bacteroidales bacterium]